MNYGFANPTHTETPAWTHPATFEPRARPYGGRLYYCCIALLLAVGAVLGANVALGDPVAGWVAPRSVPVAPAAHTTIDAETSAELQSLVRAVFTRLETRA